MKQKRINIILSLAIILILLIVAGFIYYLHKRIEGEIIALYGERQALLASEISSKFESYFGSRGQGLRILSSFESIKRRIPEQMKDDVDSYYRYVKSYFVNSILVLDENGKIIYSTLEKAIGKDCRDYEFWKRATRLTSDSLIYIPSDTSLKDLLNKNVSIILSPIYDKDKFLGAVALTIEIDSLINSFLKGMAELYESWIITSDRVLVFHSSHPEMVLRRAQLKEQKCFQCHISFDYIDAMLAKGAGVIRYRLRNYPEKFASFSRFKLGGEDLIFVVSIPFEMVRKIVTSNIYLVYLLLILTALAVMICAFVFLRNMRDIIRAEEEAKQREERNRIYRLYTLLFQNSNDGVYILDLETGRFVEVNKKFQEMFGYTQEELNSIDSIQLVAPESRPMIYERREKIARGVPVPQRYTFTALAKDGRKIDVEVSVSYVRFGEKMYVLGIYRDISEILRQRELYQSLFENLPVGVVIHRDGKIVRCNRKAVEIGGGKTEDDIVGRPVLDFVHPDYREIVKERIKKIIEEGKPAPPIEEKLVKLDGSIVDVQVMASKIIWEGRPAVQVIIEDITERKKLEREVAQRYQEKENLLLRLGYILESTEEGIYFSNDRDVIEIVNQKFCEFWGYKSPKDLLGKTIYEFINEAKDMLDETEVNINMVRNLAFRSIRERREAKYPELKLKNKKVLEAYTVPVYDPAGNYVGRLSVVSDITERKQKEKEVLTLQKFEVLGQLASGIAHDFNNVLGIITGMLELAKIKTTDENILNYIDSALSASQRGAEIAKRLLQFSKRKTEEFKPISIRELVLDTVKILEHTIPKTISIDVKITEDFTVLGSYGDLQQVILNLGLNACDAMPKGGSLTFLVSSVDKDFTEKRFGIPTSADFYAYIAVSDTGVGISEDLRDKIFEPFFTTKEPGKGTGLGLSIVKNVVTLHKGFVDFDSVVGKGTTFYVYLPVYSIGEKEVKTYRGEEKMKKIGEGYKALIVEDEESLRVIMRDYLEMLGFTVIEAEDGETALEKFRENPDVKIVFVDYGLPKMLGDELIKRVYSISPSVKFVLVTGFIDVELKESLPSGTKFIRKPYNLSQIESVVKELMGAGEE